MKRLNYARLMASNPTVYTTFVNSIGQEIKFVEHPILGDETEVIAVCEKMQLAAYTDFFEIGEIDEIGGEYEVGFVDNELFHGLS